MESKGFSLAEVQHHYHERYTAKPLVVRSPGRINFIGEHTDYNEGWVMPAAIDKEVYFCMAPSPDGNTVVHALNFNESFSVTLDNPSKVDKPHWANYLLGVIHRLLSLGHALQPFHCVMGGNIPVGAGLSSSAALECGFVLALDAMNDLGLSKLERIHIARWSEHHYAGVLCGIMDQFASTMGKDHQAILLDCRDLSHQYLPVESNEYTLVLVDSHVKHTLASSEYNVRRSECEEGVALLKKYYPDIVSLRDLSSETLLKHKDDLPEVIYKRCRYVTEENERVNRAATMLREGDIRRFAQLMFNTHEGLSSLYEVSCPELDYLVSLARQDKNILGARMMGGGFGGCTLNWVNHEGVEHFKRGISMKYTEKFDREPGFYDVNIVAGSSVILDSHG